MKWLRRYLDEHSPTLKNFADLVQRLEERDFEADFGTQAHSAPTR